MLKGTFKEQEFFLLINERGKIMKKGRFSQYGGQYAPETMMVALQELEQEYMRWRNDAVFKAELASLLHNYAGRPSLLYYAEKMTRDLGGAKIYLKREDLNHT